MSLDIIIPFDPDIKAIINKQSGDYGLILAHGSKNDINTGILPSLSKKLAEKQISSLRFNFPFMQKKSKQVDDVGTLDNVYLTVWQYAVDHYPDIKWLVGGVDIGAASAIRTSSLMMTDNGIIPTIVSLNYPLYPPHRPEMVDTSSLGAIMGDALFIQASDSNQGTYERLNNSLQMLAPHADMAKIRGADHNFKVKEKSLDRVAYWISNDIERFLNNAMK